jgi:hypothetical protein
MKKFVLISLAAAGVCFGLGGCVNKLLFAVAPLLT